MEVLTGCKVVLDEPKHIQLVRIVFISAYFLVTFWIDSEFSVMSLSPFLPRGISL